LLEIRLNGVSLIEDNFWKGVNQRRLFKAFLLGPFAMSLSFFTINFVYRGWQDGALFYALFFIAPFSSLISFVFGLPTLLLLRKLNVLNLFSLSLSGALIGIILSIYMTPKKVYISPQHSQYDWSMMIMLGLFGLVTTFFIGLIARIPILGNRHYTARKT
jgi:hypothetical protein